MRRHSALATLMLLVSLALVIPSLAAKKEKGEPGRLLTGRVVNHQDQPLTNAVVYLSNPRTRAVKTYITGPDGIYRFPALSPNIDYEVYAQQGDKKSDTKTVSQFDERKQLTINLRIDAK